LLLRHGKGIYGRQPDEEGNAIIEYYTPDSTAPEDIIIEGIDENGKVYRLTQTINK
jgi:hypothetical protein